MSSNALRVCFNTLYGDQKAVGVLFFFFFFFFVIYSRRTA
jgi:hypothetical protein